MKAFVSVSATPPVTAAAKPAPTTTAPTAVGKPPVAAPGAQPQPVAA
jgi:hypothetical protein